MSLEIVYLGKGDVESGCHLFLNFPLEKSGPQYYFQCLCPQSQQYYISL